MNTTKPKTIPGAIKAAFFDIDGTLVSFKTHVVPASAEQAIRELKEKNIRVFVATGRAIDAIGHIRYLAFDGYITFNGACCITPDGSVLFRKPIDPKDIRQLLDYTLDNPVNFSLMYEDSVSVNDVTPDIVGMHAHLNLPIPPLLDRSKVNDQNVLQANVFISPEDEIPFMKAVMPNSVATRWTPLFADVNPCDVSKMTGIEFFCRQFGIDSRETIAFGDGGNDITMIQGSGIGVAMGNANEKVKEVADYVTGDPDSGGILNALKEFGIL